VSRDTIFALATAPGRAAVAVVRISGSRAGEALQSLGGPLPSPRRASVRTLRDPGGEIVDEALVLWLPGPASYTGEDQAELQLHGGVAVVEATLDALAALGLRLAEPGEFTRRAFESGRLDLSRAEAIADLVDAETSAQRRQALAQLGGALSERYDRWRDALLDSLAWLEAEIDFPDEDLPEAVADRAGAPLGGLAAELEAALSDLRGERVREGVRVALVGAPNAGKSSLINALAERDAAIVTHIPGTTRDIIEVPLTVGGYRVVLADTAGVRATEDVVEAEGVRRARAWAEGADLRLWVVDRTAEGHWREAAGLLRGDDVLVLSKADRPAGPDAADARAHAAAVGALVLDSSTASLAGLEPVKAALAERVQALAGGADFPAATRLRHRGLLSEALDHLRRGLERLASSREPELVAEDVRLAARALERLSGRIDPDAVLDRVFGTFCIGK
jgi:tRNA modification GTPase